MPTAKTILSEDRLLRQLAKVNWDFPDIAPGSIVNSHWYPGTFPAALPGTLVEALTLPGQTVLDPFAGIGTTGWEAVRLGRRAWLVDQNLVAAVAAHMNMGLASIAATLPHETAAFFDELEAVVTAVLAEEGRLDLTLTAAKFADEHVGLNLRPSADEFLSLIRSPNYGSLSAWVEPQTLEDIRRVLEAPSLHQAPPLFRLILLTMLSAILRSASSQNQSWGHIADNVRPKDFRNKDVYRSCVRWIRRTKKSLLTAHYAPRTRLCGPTAITSLHSWTRSVDIPHAPKEKADALITSPPYSCAIDYIMSQRLSYYLFGYNDAQLSELVSEEIGARRKRFSQDARRVWGEQLSGAVRKQIGCLKETAKIALVMPHKAAGRDEGVSLMRATIQNAGWSEVFFTDRSIRQVKTRQSWTSIKKETILIYSNK